MADLLFLHGLESGPQGRKALWLAQRYSSVTPALTTSDFQKSVQEAREALIEHSPRLVIGSSYGGAVLLELVCSGVWRGPSLFLAQAGARFLPYDRLPPGVPALFLHGTEDTLIPIEDSRRLVENSSWQPSRSSLVSLWEIQDEHRLNSILGPTFHRAIQYLIPDLQPLSEGY